MAIETTTLAGGCFWCLEAVFDGLKGVVSVESGYSNGTTAKPSYEQVCTGRTGYAEVVRVSYDTDLVSFGDLLDIFFTIHDPTTLNRQGADTGTQYRSAIYYHNDEQKRIAEEKVAHYNQAGIWGSPIVTEVKPLENYHEAEDYHQEYFANNPNAGYCRVVVAPKVAKFRKSFYERLKA